MTPEQEQMLREVWAQLVELRAQIGELRTEISELEATVADLAARVERLGEVELPWPLSLLALPVAVLVAVLRRLEPVSEQALPSECPDCAARMGGKTLGGGV